MKFIFITLILFPTFCSGEFKNINCIYSKDFSVIVQFDEKKQLVKFEKFKTVNKALITKNYISWEEKNYLQIINRNTGLLKYFNITDGVEQGEMRCISQRTKSQRF
jgi:hypothetical protein